MVKLYKNDQMRIELDYGAYSGYTTNSKEQLITIDNQSALFYTPVDDLQEYPFYSLIHFKNLNNEPIPLKLTMYIHSKYDMSEAMALATFKSIDF